MIATIAISATILTFLGFVIVNTINQVNDND